MRVMRQISTSVFVFACAFSNAVFADIVIDNRDDTGEGFNDTSSVTPLDGNAANTLGQARLNAFRHAGLLIDDMLPISEPVSVDAGMDSQGGTRTSATLGSAGANVVTNGFNGAPQNNVWYPIALANQLAGEDLYTRQGGHEIVATFNSDVDNDTVLGNIDWHYGYSLPTGSDVYFVSTVEHELLHGMGFFSLVDLNDGSLFQGLMDVYTQQLAQVGASPEDFPSMSDGQRLAAMTSDGDLVWSGSNVSSAASGLLSNGLNTGQAQMYAPSPVQVGSSVSHFDTDLTPNELMEPFDTGDFEAQLSAALMADIGWGATNSNPQVGEADLSVTVLNDATSDTQQGDVVAYEVSIRNDGPDAATDATVVLVLTEDVSFQGASTPQGSCNLNGDLLRCNMGSIASSDSVSFDIRLTMLGSGTVSNTFNVSGPQTDPVLNGNTQAVAFNVVAVEGFDGGSSSGSSNSSEGGSWGLALMLMTGCAAYMRRRPRH